MTIFNSSAVDWMLFPCSLLLTAGAFAEYILPSRVRNLLSAESGINDGIGFPLLMFPLTLTLGQLGMSSSWQAARFLVSTAAVSFLHCLILLSVLCESSFSFANRNCSSSFSFSGCCNWLGDHPGRTVWAPLWMVQWKVRVPGLSCEQHTILLIQLAIPASHDAIRPFQQPKSKAYTFI